MWEWRWLRQRVFSLKWDEKPAICALASSVNVQNFHRIACAKKKASSVKKAFYDVIKFRSVLFPVSIINAVAPTFRSIVRSASPRFFHFHIFPHRNCLLLLLAKHRQNEAKNVKRSWQFRQTKHEEFVIMDDGVRRKENYSPPSPLKPTINSSIENLIVKA